MTLNNDALIRKDRLRYTKNKLSANLALLAIVLNALYFVCLYSLDIHRDVHDLRTSYHTWMIGISVLFNLIFMLVSFLASEGVKNYKLGYGYTLILLGAAQVARIFIMPFDLHHKTVSIDDVIQPIMTDEKFILCAAYLIGSAALCVVAGVIAVIKTTTLRNYEAELERRGNKS